MEDLEIGMQPNKTRAVNNEISNLTNNPVNYTTENVALNVPSKNAKLTEKIEEAISLYENGTIKGNVITDYVLAFLDPSFQGLKKQTKKKFCHLC